MSTYASSNTLTGSSYGITFTPDTGEKAPKTPSGLIVTQAVQTRLGWLGQVIVDKEIVWESAVIDEGGDAIRAANERVVEAFKTLFGWTPPAEPGTWTNPVLHPGD